MAADASKLIIPGHGTVFYAEPGTKPPANPVGSGGFNLQTDGPAPWKNLGHTSKQNTIAFTKEGGDRTSIDTFLADAVRTTQDSTTWGVTVAALQFDEANLRFAFNGEVDADTGGYTVATASPVQASLFLYFQDTTGALGFWLPNTEISLGDAPSVDTTQFFEMPLNVSILSADADLIAPIDGRAGLFQIFHPGITAGSGGSGGSGN